MSKLGDLWSLLTAFPSVPLAPSLLLRPSLECSALDTLDCISINSSVTGSAHWRKVYPTPLRSLPPPPHRAESRGLELEFTTIDATASFQSRFNVDQIFVLLITFLSFLFLFFFHLLLRIAVSGKICCRVFSFEDVIFLVGNTRPFLERIIQTDCIFARDRHGIFHFFLFF